jgi:hypothetical protein
MSERRASRRERDSHRRRKRERANEPSYRLRTDPLAFGARVVSRVGRDKREIVRERRRKVEGMRKLERLGHARRFRPLLFLEVNSRGTIPSISLSSERNERRQNRRENPIRNKALSFRSQQKTIQHEQARPPSLPLPPDSETREVVVKLSPSDSSGRRVQFLDFVGREIQQLFQIFADVERIFRHLLPNQPVVRVGFDTFL